MVENRPLGNLIPHLILWIGVIIVAFPVYLAFIGSTHEASVIANGQMPLTPGAKFLENYYRTIFIGTSGTTREPVATMLFNSFVMAMSIAIGIGLGVIDDGAHRSASGSCATRASTTSRSGACLR